MITSIITENELYKLHRGFKKWYGRVEPTKETNYIYHHLSNYFNLCHKYYLKSHSLNQLIKLFYKGKQTFYTWSNKIKEFLLNSYDFEWFKKTSTRPKTIHYHYSKIYKRKIAKMIKTYREKYGTGIYEFYNLTLANYFTYQNMPIKHNIKTLIKWDKTFNNYSKRKNIKKIYQRYEMPELGHVQHDVKILTKNMTGYKKDLYIFDYIDEKSRYAVAYVSAHKTQDIAAKLFEKAYFEFKNIGINIKRIRTDNGTEYVYNHRSNYAHRKSEFTKAVNKKGVAHQTTPVRSPQSNGKIERFHRNWNKFFEYLPRYLKEIDDIEKQIKIFLNYYNNIRRHKSINLLTPAEAVLKFLKD
ncbi:IS481 family transposase [Spiroplasma chrysopicola]|uniref:Putative transposase n=1 Tax=Spiroplasma chrysopicola DF-1 TaxID=1276227 RepID=R4U2M4_9MOLU|nr:IS481 family transposase [Spiroplasma chrysopicola]AGM24657.1 putative transposase [Spiroplasma chrysopicola DF-1]AGM24703.1 putative transposase [Spiroplasma chrysopicola DF-1]AGM24957.1 putative transposase [Spiroplasma chrysopicola DF-1]AGM25260.1 putative transposase [Spiroplasma chrysopicola DF-1]